MSRTGGSGGQAQHNFPAILECLRELSVLLLVALQHASHLRTDDVRPELHQLTFELFAAFWLRMIGVKDGLLFGSQAMEVGFENRLFKAQSKMIIHPPVHGYAADVVVVVAKMQRWKKTDFVLGPIHFVDLL